MTEEYHLNVSYLETRRVEKLTWPGQPGRGMVGLPPTSRQLVRLRLTEAAYLQPSGIVSQQPGSF